jgi:hypothetical protein
VKQLALSAVRLSKKSLKINQGVLIHHSFIKGLKMSKTEGQPSSSSGSDKKQDIFTREIFLSSSFYFEISNYVIRLLSAYLIIETLENILIDGGLFLLDQKFQCSFLGLSEISNRRRSRILV